MLSWGHFSTWSKARVKVQFYKAHICGVDAIYQLFTHFREYDGNLNMGWAAGIVLRMHPSLQHHSKTLSNLRSLHDAKGNCMHWPRTFDSVQFPQSGDSKRLIIPIGTANVNHFWKFRGSWWKHFLTKGTLVVFWPNPFQQDKLTQTNVLGTRCDSFSLLLISDLWIPMINLLSYNITATHIIRTHAHM